MTTKQLRNVIVAVRGTQKDISGQEEKIELVTVGRYSRKNDTDYILYEESEISGMEDTTTTLKITTDRVVMLRRGRVEHKQEFIAGQKTESIYHTPYGALGVGIMTQNLVATAYQADTNEQQVAYIRYELEIEGQWQSTNTLSITVREEESHGYKNHLTASH